MKKNLQLSILFLAMFSISNCLLISGTVFAKDISGLAAPTDLTAVPVSSSQINLSWTDNSSGESVFRIEFSLTGVLWTLKDSVGANVTSYNNTQLNGNTVYFYRVCAAEGGATSGYSNIASAQTLLITPVHISPSDGSTNQPGNPNLRWANFGGIQFYHLQVSRDAGFSSLIINDSNLTQASYIIPLGFLNEYTTYYWHVRCRNTNNAGLYSSAWNFTTGQMQGPNTCEDFSADQYPPPTMTEDFITQSYWSRQPQSAYDIGSGSLRFKSWSAPAGTVQPLVTYSVPPFSFNYLTFDNAYGPYAAGYVDSLIIETSTNGGASYSTLVNLWGGLGAQAGPLNTVFTAGSEFTPLPHQWASKIYALPAGTNKIKFKAVSGFGNDIWLDNVCIQTYVPAVTSSIAFAPQGFFRTPPASVITDTVRIYLKRTDYPNICVDSATVVEASYGSAEPVFTRALSGQYYIVVKHRNSIETWSKAGGVFYNRGSGFIYSFLHFQDQAYNNNTIQIDPHPYFGLYSGDVDQSGAIELTDLIGVYNDAIAFTTGYKVTDVTGNNITDGSDVIIIYNNCISFVQVQRPPGATFSSATLTGNVVYSK